jgi:hypothetical protein
MSAMGLPGFTADVSLYKTRAHYQTVTALGENSGVSPQQMPVCHAVSESCASPGDCCAGYCNEDNKCDCFAVGENCQLGPRSCCSGLCGPDGTCVLCTPSCSDCALDSNYPGRGKQTCTDAMCNTSPFQNCEFCCPWARTKPTDPCRYRPHAHDPDCSECCWHRCMETREDSSACSNDCDCCCTAAGFDPMKNAEQVCTCQGYTWDKVMGCQVPLPGG